jgi:guanylate kinase
VSRTGILLYGPPASGKDTVTQSLVMLNPDYVPFRRLKVGSGRTYGYRLATLEEVAALRVQGLVLYENERYGNRYIIDRPELDRLISAGLTPVVHLGQFAGLSAVTRYPLDWVPVLLWCSRETTRQRLQQRGGTDDLDERLLAWDETHGELEQVGLGAFSRVIHTDDHSPTEAAQTIHDYLVADYRQSAQTI